MSYLSHIARDSGTGLVLLHHARKSDGAYRDSSAIGAGVDVVIEMSEGDTQGVRKFRVRGRWAMDDFSARLVEAGEDTPAYYELASGEVGIDAQVLAFVERNPGCSQRRVREHVRSNAVQVREAIHRLIQGREVEDRGNARGMKLHRAEKRLQTATEPPQNHPGTGFRNHGAKVVPERGDPRRGSPSEPPPEPLEEIRTLLVDDQEAKP